jgi:acyl carrier protein
MCALSLGARDSNMQPEEIRERVKAVLVDVLKLAPSEELDDAMLLEDFVADSLVGVEVFMEIEHVFAIELPDDATDDVITFADLNAMVSQAKKMQKVI